MNQGHLKSILPQRGGVSPVDNNTVALFHYDEHAKDSIKGIMPMGNSRSLSLDGLSSYVTFGDVPEEISKIEIDFYTPAVISPDSTGQFLLQTNGDNSGILFGNFTGSFVDEIISFYPNGTTNSLHWRDANASVSVGWHNLTIEYDVSLSSYRLYMDGSEKTLYVRGSQPPRFACNSLQIGRRDYAGGGLYFKGSVNNLKLNDGSAGYWKLSEGEGSIAYDYSDSGNDGFVTNGAWVQGQAMYAFNKVGILLEEPTTNFMTAPHLANNPNRIVGSSSLEQQDFLVDGQNLKGVTLNQGVTTDIISISFVHQLVSNASTLSLWIRSDKYNPLKAQITCTVDAVEYWLDNAGQWVTTTVEKNNVFGNYTALGEWQHITFSIGFPSGSLTAFGIGGFYRTTGNFTMSLANVQLENKPYTTSFVEGSRQGALLEYPEGIIDFAAGTFSCWAKTTAPGTKYLFKQWGVSGASGSHFALYMRSDGTIQYEYGAENIVSPLTYNDGQWHHYAITWLDGTDQLHLYVDGERIASSTAIKTMENVGGRKHGSIPLGHRGWTYRDAWWNGVIDELRIDKVARTEAEIQAWYYQGRNGW